ncbi:MFS transporter [Piscinibacter sp. Jin2]|uniref:MFS transporter n=1 Tax=Aquariibacter lacus TaxID=2801332 RepID=A0A9X1BRS3_9BURK|nr:MFS transporter [Piscinibacter lacus]MBL0720259.1 MFS transporter [Piscinibacter lacus]
MTALHPGAPALSLRQLLICGAAIVTLSMGVRHGFGLWLTPITVDRGWTRETFAFAMAVQNLVWGLAGPLVGMLADRHGALRVLGAGALLYALGLAGMALAGAPTAFLLSSGGLIGLAQAGTTYAVVYGVIGRHVPAERRSWAMGLTAAAGSFGQFLMVPLASGLIDGLGWQQALLLMAGAVLLILPLAWGLREPPRAAAAPGEAPAQGAGAAIREALGERRFLLLTAGYFVCGFQVVFIGVHLPSYLRDHGLGLDVATGALALIGLFNVIGTYLAGLIGQRHSKPRLLAAIYALRSGVIVVFLLAPLSALSVYLFAAAMGLLWLSTVPPTNALVAQIFGVRHLSMLGGTVFLSHQLGSFLGVWLGGWLYDRQGSYDAVWGLCIVLGLVAALLNLPVRETPLARLRPATS